MYVIGNGFESEKEWNLNQFFWNHGNPMKPLESNFLAQNLIRIYLFDWNPIGIGIGLESEYIYFLPWNQNLIIPKKSVS